MNGLKTTICVVFLCLVAFEGFSQDLNDIKIEVDEVKVYPNPLIQQNKFIVKSETIISKVEVVNIIGKVINRTENKNFNIKEIPVFVGNCEKGMYFVKITFDNNNSLIKKLLVK